MGAGRDEQAEHSRYFSGNESILYDMIMMDIHYYYIFAQTHRMYNTKSEP